MSVPIHENVLRILENQNVETLAKWWCELNRWEWPPELPDPEEPVRGPGWIANSRRDSIMCFIADRVGNYLISKEWNKDHLTQTKFEDWYRQRFLAPIPGDLH